MITWEDKCEHSLQCVWKRQMISCVPLLCLNTVSINHTFHQFWWEGSVITDVSAVQYCGSQWHDSVHHSSQKLSDIFLASSSMCGVGGYHWVGFCLQHVRPAGLVVFLCLPFKGPLWLPWLPCFFGLCLACSPWIPQSCTKQWLFLCSGVGGGGLEWMPSHSHEAHWLHTLCLQLFEITGCLTEALEQTQACLINSSHYDYI